MFGLENRPKKPSGEFHFELEKELGDPKKHKLLKTKVESQIQEIKKLLREGENKKDFESLALILHGFNAMLRVFSRFEGGKK
jgi:hypothetical protein